MPNPRRTRMRRWKRLVMRSRVFVVDLLCLYIALHSFFPNILLASCVKGCIIITTIQALDVGIQQIIGITIYYRLVGLSC